MAKKMKKESVSEQVQVQDAFSNALYRLGFGSTSPMEATTHPLTRLSDNYQLLNSLYRGSWLVQTIVDCVPDDMLREWYEIGGELPPEEISKVQRAERITQLKDRIGTGLKWGRLYGGAVGLLLIRGQEDELSEPLRLDTILPSTFAGLHILDRWTGVSADCELVEDITDPDFGLPMYYQIQTGGSGQKVHHSRIVRFVGRELPYLEKIAEMYWGESEIESLYQDLVFFENVVANVANLTFRANVSTMEVQNLDQLFSIGGIEQQRRFWNVVQNQNVVRSNFGIQLVNKGDKIESHPYNFSGLDAVYQTMCQNLSGATHIPMTKLFGRSPSGLNSTGESDMRNYYDFLDSLRESKLRSVLEKILPILCASSIGYVPKDLEIRFPPLWTPSAEELANTNAKGTETIISAFQAGLIDLATAKAELKKLNGIFDGIEDDEIAQSKGKNFQDVTTLRDPMSGLEMENETATE